MDKMHSICKFKDLSTALVGKFTDGQMDSAMEARLQGLTCRLVVLDEVLNDQTSFKMGGGQLVRLFDGWNPIQNSIKK